MYLRDKHALLVAVLLLLLGNPYFTWSLPMRPIAILLMQIIVLFECRKQRMQGTATDQKLIILFVITWVYWAFLTIYHGILNINGLITNLCVCFFFIVSFTKGDFRKRVFQNYTTLYAFVILVSMICWIMAINGFLPSIGTITHYNSSMDRSYMVYPFVVIEHMNLIDGIRFSGIYDEPGVIGTIGIILLAIGHFNMKDWRNIVILISGILSMSFFFYLVLIVYASIYFVSRKKWGILILFLLLIGGFYQATKDNPVMQYRLWGRMEWNPETGKFVGDNRMVDEGDAYYERIKGTSEYYFGVNDVKAYWDAARGSSSYKNVIAMYGIIYLVLYCLYFLLLSYSHNRKKKDFLLFALLFLATLYQRANLYYIDFIFLYSCLAMINEDNVDNYYYKDEHK